MSDNSLLSAGPNSILSLDRYEFDSTTSQGQFDTTLQKGDYLAVIMAKDAVDMLDSQLAPPAEGIH